VTAPGDRVEAGHAFYTRRTLRIYDPMILGFFSRTAWRCPADRLVQHYDRHVTANHLDVGAGTGYFIDRCRFPEPDPRIGLLDLNTDCLDAAAARIARYRPERYVGNVLEPLALGAEPFDSVSMNYLLHCVPGTMAEKAVVFEHLARLVRPGGVLFGATLLHDGVERTWYARQIMRRNNRVGIFSNQHDSLEGLRRALDTHLVDPSVEVVGCVGIFAGTVREHA
jgi:ubiquinone/menaquinone biosynthesis C-methylase UbiE